MILGIAMNVACNMKTVFPTHSWIMRRAPLAPLAVGLMIGIALDHHNNVDAIVPIILLLICTALMIYKKTRLAMPSFLLCLAAIAAGTICHAMQHSSGVINDLAKYVPEGRILARLEGTIATEPRVMKNVHLPFRRWRFVPEKTIFLLDVNRIELGDGYHETKGRVRVTVSEAVLDIQSGEKVSMLGWYYGFAPPKNPGSYDWDMQHRRQGIVAGLTVNRREAVQHISTQTVETQTWISQFRDYARRMLTSDLSAGTSEQVGLLQAMILGHRSSVDRKLNDIFVRAGCVHFLAVSGIHLGIVMLLLRLAVQPIPILFSRRYWIMGLGIIMYVLLAEPRPSILRAATMGLLYCIASLLGRRRAFINAIAAAAMLLLTLDAESMFDVGFQLSFAAVCGIAIIAPSLHSLMQTVFRRIKLFLTRTSKEEDALISALRPLSPPSRASWMWQRIRRWIVAGMAVSLSCWLIALPIVVVHFQRIPVWGALNSLLVLPLVTLVMALGFAKMTLMVAAPWLIPSINYLLTSAESLLINFVDYLSMLPASVVYITMPSTPTIVLFYALLLAVAWLGHTKKQLVDSVKNEALSFDSFTKNNNTLENINSLNTQDKTLLKSSTRKAYLLCAITAALLFTSRLPWSRWMTSQPSLRITFLSVGAGSATVIELPDGQTWLYDAGTSSNYDLARSTLLPFLSTRGISRIDRIILSHPNLDHYSAIPRLLDSIDCGPIVVNRFFDSLASQTGAGRELLETIQARHHPLERQLTGTIMDLPPSVQLTQIWPTAQSPETLSANDSSFVLKISFAGQSLLLTGDIENAALRVLCQRNDIRADILYLPHHGDVEPYTHAFLESVQANRFIRSTHQRTEDTKNGLLQLVNQENMFNTAEVGAITVVINNSGMAIKTHIPKN